ncbi:carboxy terminal-processing peptidase [Desulfuromonas versatilis]|nr:carboxy terminal-processing peptidase [Desulfuromonas versatilis]
MLLLVACLLSPAASAVYGQGSGDYDANRAKLLSYMVRQQLERYHYSHKALNDQLSKDAFALFLKQLDFQKRFLLKSDVAKLQAYMNQIDDEMQSGDIQLPVVAANLMAERIPQAQALVEELLANPFDFTVQESFETDPEKLDFCENLDQLRERWRQALKFQALTRYLNLIEDEGLKEAGDQDPRLEALRGKAREKVLNSNRHFFTRLLQDTRQDHYDRFLNAVTRAFDPHTNYLPPTQKEDFDISMRGSLEGIGATLREEDGYIKVVRVIPGSAAYRQGQLQAEDVILEVAQGSEEPVDVTDTRLRDAVSLIRGPKGSEVRLTVKKADGSRLVIPIIRDVVEIEETFVKGATFPDPASGKTFGYIKIPSFYRDFQGSRLGGEGRNSTDDVREQLRLMNEQNIAGLILDLRNNGGGALTDAVGIAGLFIETGPIVQVRSSNGQINVLEDRDPKIDYAGPMVVLVNQFSASASEILAGAMQDYGRAIVMGGAHTHGKGTVQTILDLDRTIPLPNMGKYRPLGAIKVTTQKFYRISGGSTQFKGVVPDIVLPDRLGHLKSGEQYSDYALPWDTVAATEFQPWAPALGNLAGLKQQSSARVAASESFNEISQDADSARQKSEQTSQSLFIDQVRREREEARQHKAAPAFHEGGEPGEEEPGDNARLSDEERRNLWIKETGEDPYVREAMALIGQILALGSQPATPAGESKAVQTTPYSRPKVQ